MIILDFHTNQYYLVFQATVAVVGSHVFYWVIGEVAHIERSSSQLPDSCTWDLPLPQRRQGQMSPTLASTVCASSQEHTEMEGVGGRKGKEKERGQHSYTSHHSDKTCMLVFSFQRVPLFQKFVVGSPFNLRENAIRVWTRKKPKLSYSYPVSCSLLFTLERFSSTRDFSTFILLSDTCSFSFLSASWVINDTSHIQWMCVDAWLVRY